MNARDKYYLAWISFVFLNDALCDPLWFNVLYFTTKELKGFHKGHKGFFQHTLDFSTPLVPLLSK